MVKKIKDKVNWLRLALVIGIMSVLAPKIAEAQLVPPVAPAGTASTGLVVAIYNIINVLLVLVGVVAVIYLIVGGMRYITSRGDETAAKEAKGTILYAVIGLIVIGLAAAIVRFVIGAINVA